MLPTGRLNDDSRRRGDADATPPFRSMMMSRPVVPPPSTGSRLQSTESAKSAVSEAMSAASSSDAGSFWGLGPAAPSSLVYEPSPPSDLKSAPPRLAVIRQQSSISTAAGPPARLHAAMFGDAPANDSFPNAADASDRARSSSSSSSTSGSWNVTSASLQPLPPFFPVERTHAVLNPKEDEELEEKGQEGREKREDEVSAAACRIAKCLDDLCIAAVYDDERAVCLATTGDRCRFCIRFFRIEKGGVDQDEEGSLKDSAASGESGKEEGCVLLELQRRRGSCLSFRSAAREILRAAKSSEPSRSAGEGPQRSSSSPSPTSVEVRPPLCPLSFSSGRQDLTSEQEGQDQEGENKEEEECPAAACINNVVRLLTEEGGRIDAQLLAIDSLRCVSDADRNNRGYARKAARKVLFCGKAESVKCREALMRILSARRHGGGRGSEEDQEDEDDEPDNLETHFIDEMRGLALSALANSLEAAAANPPAEAGGKEEQGSSTSSKIPLDDLVPSLLGDVLRLPPSRPHDAAEAARCLTGLLRATPAEASSPDSDSDIGPRSLSSRTFGILHGLGARDRIARLREEETVIAHSRLCLELDALLGAYDEAAK